MSTKLLVVGWDGAEWSIIRRLMDEGRLPNVSALIEGGRGYGLRVPIPPATFSSWTTILTGTNPARHGITDFSELMPGIYRIRFLTALDRAEPAIWEYLDELGARTCVLGFPATFPPDEIDGFFLSGFESPVAVSADESFAYPKEIYARLTKKFGHWLVGGIQEFRITSGWQRRALEHALMSLERKLSYAIELANGHGPFDAFFVWFGEADTISHHFWRFYDPGSPRFDSAGAEEFGGAIPLVYHRLDYALGVLMEELAPDNVIIVSDHGFGGAGTTAFHINAWLKQNGYLQFRAVDEGWRFLSSAQKLALQYVPAQLQERFFRAQVEWAERTESRVRFGKIDFARTRAFSEELNYAPSVRLNLFGREPEGVVKQGELEEILSELAGRLESQETQDGIGIVKKAWRREELYAGPFVERMPELIIEQSYPLGYSVNFLKSASDSPAIRNLDMSELAGAKGAGMNGTHRQTGVFIVSGPAKSKLSRRKACDAVCVAPTALGILGYRAERMEAESVYRADGLHDVTCERKPPKGREKSAIALKLKEMGYLS